MKARMTDRVRLPDGEVATLNELLAAGRLTFSHSPAVSFSGRGKARSAYFAGVDGFVVEVSKADYETHVSRVFPAGGSAVGQKNLRVGQPGHSAIMDCALSSRVYGEWCRDPQACRDKDYCPKDPTCAD